MYYFVLKWFVKGKCVLYIQFYIFFDVTVFYETKMQKEMCTGVYAMIFFLLHQCLNSVAWTWNTIEDYEADFDPICPLWQSERKLGV